MPAACHLKHPLQVSTRGVRWRRPLAANWRRPTGLKSEPQSLPQTIIATDAPPARTAGQPIACRPSRPTCRLPDHDKPHHAAPRAHDCLARENQIKNRRSLRHPPSHIGRRCSADTSLPRRLRPSAVHVDGRKSDAAVLPSELHRTRPRATPFLPCGGRAIAPAASPRHARKESAPPAGGPFPVGRLLAPRLSRWRRRPPRSGTQAVYAWLQGSRRRHRSPGPPRTRVEPSCHFTRRRPVQARRRRELARITA